MAPVQAVLEGTAPAARTGLPRASVVEAQNLSLIFQTPDAPVTALNEINLTIRRGDFVSLIGPSGCGKTTLMRVVADLAQPTSGTLLVNGGTAGQAGVGRAGGAV